MTRDQFTDAQLIISKLDDVDRKIDSINEIKTFISEDKNGTPPSINLKMLGGDLIIRCNDEDGKKLFNKFIKDAESFYNKKKKELEKNLESI